MSHTLPCLGCGRWGIEGRETCPQCNAPLVAPHPSTWGDDLKQWLHHATVQRVLKNYGGDPAGYPSLMTALFRGQQVTPLNTDHRIVLPHSLTVHEAYPLALRLAGLLPPIVPAYGHSPTQDQAARVPHRSEHRDRSVPAVGVGQDASSDPVRETAIPTSGGRPAVPRGRRRPVQQE